MRFLAWAARTAYQAMACLGWPVLFLYYFCRSHTDGKYRDNYRSRLGLDLPAPLPAPGSAGRVWVHALSVGEVLSAIPLIAELKKKSPGLEIFLSTATETGMSLGRDRLSSLVDGFFFLPHDFPWSARSLAARIRPSAFVLIETDFWPNLVHHLRKNFAFTFLVNGRISPGSYRGYSRLASFSGMIFRKFDLLFVQTERDRSRFLSFGCAPERVVSAGNLKFDSSAPRLSGPEVLSLRNEIGLGPKRPVWVAGSTHEGEEAILLRIHRDLLEKIPDLLLIVAPRNIGRSAEIERLSLARGLSCAVRSRREKVSGAPVYLLDTLGELARFYAVGDIAFIGGSLVPFGGHNPLEVLAQGKPVCWGPHFFNFYEIGRTLLESGHGEQISSEKELAEFVEQNLITPGKGARDKESSESVSRMFGGVAERIGAVLLETIRDKRIPRFRTDSGK